GLSFEQDNLEIVQRLIIHPANPAILLAATRNGIFRTTDGGTNWTMVNSTHCYDMAFNTSNPDIIYAGGNQDILQSTDAGSTWSILKDNLGGAGRISIETSAADPAVIYALYESNSKLYKSTNGGTSWSTVQSPSSATFYGYYDMAFTVSPADANILFAGGLLVTKSVNGGQSWQVVSAWDSYPSDDYVHADNHALSFDPSGATIYSGNDGGLFKSTNLGGAWTDLSNGLSISQIYRLSSSVTNPDIIYSGWQDNGSNRWNGTNWKQVFGADGMQPLVDYTNENIVYICYQYGALHKSTDGGENFQYVAPSSGGWVTPYAMDPSNHNILYYGANSMYKTTNGASNWTAAGSNLFNSFPCNAIAIAPSNTSYVYAASLDKMFVTSSGGNPWTNITAGLPVTTSGINYIAIDNTDPLNVWVAISGYVSGNKVFHSTNGGNSWSNVSGSLPNVPINCIVYEPDSQNGIYIGTDIGVFYIDNTLSDWVTYNAGLPNVMVHHLEINPTSGKLMAATYGRGIWESDLFYTEQFVNDIGIISIAAPSNEVCSSIVNPVIKVKNFGSNSVTSFNVLYAVDGGSNLNYEWSGSLDALASVVINLPAITGLDEGVHTFSVSTSLPNGITDNNTVNDANNSSFTIIGSGLLLPYQEGFETGVFPPDGWTFENDNLLWSATDAAGGFGNSSYSAQADFFSVLPGSIDKLMTPYLDFTTAIPTLKLKFTYAYAKKSITKTDTLKIAVSADCGATFTNVFVKGGTDLATAPDQTGTVFIPSISEWKDEIIDLTSFSSADKMLVRFSAISDKGNNLYLDDINLYGLSTSFENIILNDGFQVYPNPAADEFTVSLNGKDVEDVTIEVFNMLGQKVNATVNKTNTAALTYHLRLMTVANGWHLVKVKTSNQTFVQPLLIER
ncbi:MAG: T9SS type A sorting domain-containing protein, partial [Chitinophagales bacterium]